MEQHERVPHTVSALRVFRRALRVPSDVMLLCAVVSSINVWLAVAEYCSVCVLASLIWKYVCLGGYLKGFSTVAEVSHHDTFSESSEQHISGIVSIIRRHTDTPAFHFLIVFSESQRQVMAL